MKLLLRRGNGHWAEPEISGHQSEDALQQLLATAPDLLPGAETGLPLAVAREFPVATGRIDLLGVDVDGEITLCECKLATNPGIRREVIGQLLEYASALQGVSQSAFAARFESPHNNAAHGRGRQTRWRGLRLRRLRAAGRGQPGCGPVQARGRRRSISDALRQSVLYLNDHLDRPVLALELAYLRDGDVEMLLPQVYGTESAERKRPSRSETVADADTVIVAARDAYDTYLGTEAYVCQPLRSFRDDIKYLGFYKDKAIQPEVAVIRHRRKSVIFSRDEVARLRATGDARDAEVAALINDRLSSGTDGREHQVFLLSAKDDPDTLKLPKGIRHTDRGAWTQAQRYTQSSALRLAPETTSELAANGG